MKPKSGSLEDDVPFQLGAFKVQNVRFGGSTLPKTRQSFTREQQFSSLAQQANQRINFLGDGTLTRNQQKVYPGKKADFVSNEKDHLAGGSKYFLCSPLPGEDSHFD